MEFSLTRKSAFLLVGVLGAMGILLFSAGCLVGIGLWAPDRADIEFAQKSRLKNPEIQPVLAPLAVASESPAIAKPAPVEATHPAVTTEADPFSVQVGAFRDAANANKLVAELKERYPSATVFTASDLEKHMWHAVRIGSYKDLDSASRFAADFTNKEQRQAVVRPSGSL